MTDLATAPTSTLADAVLRLVEPVPTRHALVGVDVVVAADRPLGEIAATARAAVAGSAFTLGSVTHHGARRVRCRLALAEPHLHVRWSAVVDVQVRLGRHLELCSVERLDRAG